ncbi:hypothetical protein C4D60_Mb04t23960 [Musa balbisiana]|uniref:Uncharacterized protein n=1 Tax=Musa balbisiana TaxID=52838 RepID=A0A4S8KE89_MUSBA|nr:hypothetical protein C4D60_Mb04t23960 [Musa balbisiana]
MSICTRSFSNFPADCRTRTNSVVRLVTLAKYCFSTIPKQLWIATIAAAVGNGCHFLNTGLNASFSNTANSSKSTLFPDGFIPTSPSWMTKTSPLLDRSSPMIFAVETASEISFEIRLLRVVGDLSQHRHRRAHQVEDGVQESEVEMNVQRVAIGPVAYFGGGTTGASPSQGDDGVAEVAHDFRVLASIDGFDLTGSDDLQQTDGRRVLPVYRERRV